MKTVIWLFIAFGISYFIFFNDAFKDGEDLARQLCNCYKPESDKFATHGVDAIKIPDKYIYFSTEEYPEFRKGFLTYAAFRCPQYRDKLFRWRGIGENEYPVDHLPHTHY
jgi:hypothetical protein